MNIFPLISLLGNGNRILTVLFNMHLSRMENEHSHVINNDFEHISKTPVHVYPYMTFQIYISQYTSSHTALVD